MPTFSYTAKTAPDTVLKGEIDAHTQAEAVGKLVQRGYFLLSIAEKNPHVFNAENIFWQKIPHRDVILFTRQLASLTEASVDIIKSLNIVANQASNKRMKAVINGIIEKIKDGKSLSQSLSEYPALFPALYSAMVHAGEISGNLVLVIQRLADFLEKDEELKSSFYSSLTYPLFVFFVGVLTVFALLAFVVPRLVSIFEDMGQILPLPTRIVIAVSSFFQHYWLLLLAAIAVVFLALQNLRHNPVLGLAWDRARLKVPLLGYVVLYSQISRFTRTLSLLLANGIAIVSSLEISASIVQNEVLRREIQRFRQEIIGGGSLSKSLEGSAFFPGFVTNIVAIGEETGTLENSLLKVSDNYDRDVERVLRTLTKMIEPVIILFGGLVVGSIVIAMLLPIFQINFIVR